MLLQQQQQQQQQQQMPPGRPTPTVVSIQGADFSRWTTLYPAYIDEALTCEQGRRIPKGDACVKPYAVEMYRVLIEMGFREVAVEQLKVYSRESNVRRGRVRFHFKVDGKSQVPEFTSKRQIMIEMAHRISKLDKRLYVQIQEQLQKQASSASTGSASASSASTSEKGKKKKR